MFHPIHFWRTVIISEQSSGLVLYLLVDVILDDQAFTLVLGGFYLEAFQVDSLFKMSSMWYLSPVRLPLLFVTSLNVFILRVFNK